VLSGEGLAVWRQGDVKSRTNGPSRVPAVLLGWNQAATNTIARYRVTLGEAAAAQLRLDAASRLVLMVADTKTAAESHGVPTDFTIEIATADGAVARVPLSRIAPLPPMPRVRFTKWRLLDRAFYVGETEPVFQTYELPLRQFAEPWQPSNVSEIRLVFDRTPAGTIALHDVGFAREPGAE
jgi:hypothetical protein